MTKHVSFISEILSKTEVNHRKMELDPKGIKPIVEAVMAQAVMAQSSTQPSLAVPGSPLAPLPMLTTCSLGILPKEPPDVAFERLCKMHQSTGNQQLCQVCQRIFPNWYKLKQHLHTHADFRPYTCAYCDKTFRNYSKKSRHEKTHSGLKPYVCKICNKHVSRSEHLKRHLLTHTEAQPYKCIICDYRSRRLDCIRYHMKNKHPEKESKILFNQQIVDANDDHPNDASDLLWQQYKESAETIMIPAVSPPHPPGDLKPKKKKKKKSGDTQVLSHPFPDGKMPPYPVSAIANVLHTTAPQFPMPVPVPTSPLVPGFGGDFQGVTKDERPLIPGLQLLQQDQNQHAIMMMSQGRPSTSQVSNQSTTPTKSPSAVSYNHASPANVPKNLDSSFSEDEGNSQSKYFLSPGLLQKANLELPKSKRKNSVPMQAIDASRLQHFC